MATAPPRASPPECTPAPRPPSGQPAPGSTKAPRLGLPGGVGVDGVGGSRRIADASAMRLDVVPNFLHPDVTDASGMRRGPDAPSTRTSSRM
eukprot:2116237-Pyramimonas_sp.AAC.1